MRYFFIGVPPARLTFAGGSLGGCPFTSRTRAGNGGHGNRGGVCPNGSGGLTANASAKGLMRMPVEDRAPDVRPELLQNVYRHAHSDLLGAVGEGVARE